MHLSTHPTSYPTRYQEIAAKLEQELRQHYRCGDYLPAEQQLAARFEVNRHTLRRAIDQLVEKRLGTAPSGRRRAGADAPVRLPAQRPGRVLARTCWTRGSHPTSEKTAVGIAPRVRSRR